MSTIYNPEADIMAEIERLELEAREIRRRMDNAKSKDDQRVLTKQLGETEEQIELLKARLP